MSGPLRVYVSSTFEDLKSLRARVLKVVAALEATAVAMENYGAHDQSALDKCVDDVTRCDIYIGIIGWHYGSCPAGSAVSFTEHEFSAATAAKIPRLIYMSSDATAPGKLREHDPIVRFRASASVALMRRTFEDEADLATYVATDLGRELRRLTAPQGSEQLLPYLCDREPQTQEIVTELAEPNAAIPAICLLHGASNQSPLKFLDCLRHVHLPECTRSPLGATREFIVPWPESDAANVGRAVRLSLARSLKLDVRTPPNELEAHVRTKVTEHPGPVLVTCHAPAGKLDADEIERLRKIVEYFEQWPVRKPRKPDLIVICLSYPASKPGLLAAIGLDNGSRQSNRIRSIVSELAAERTIRVLPELTDVSMDDAAAWARREELRRLAIERDLEPEVMRIFATRNLIPMADLAPRLLEILTASNRS